MIMKYGEIGTLTTSMEYTMYVLEVILKS